MSNFLGSDCNLVSGPYHASERVVVTLAEVFGYFYYVIISKGPMIICFVFSYLTKAVKLWPYKECKSNYTCRGGISPIRLVRAHFARLVLMLKYDC